MPTKKHVSLVRLHEIAPNVVIQRPPTRDKSRPKFALVTAATLRPEVEEKSVDLLSVTSDDYKEDDQISFDEGRLQQWNYPEFHIQLLSAVAGMVLLFACGTMSAWAITDFIKDFQQNDAEWLDVDYSFDLLDTQKDSFLESHHIIIAMVVLSYNVGCIVGAICGAFITPLLPNRIIYVSMSREHRHSAVKHVINHSRAFYRATHDFN